MTISSFVLLAALAVVEHDSSFDILRDDVVVARDIRVDRGANVGAEDVRSTATTLPDGTKVWNRWSEGADRRFRLEVGQGVAQGPRHVHRPSGQDDGIGVLMQKGLIR